MNATRRGQLVPPKSLLLHVGLRRSRSSGPSHVSVDLQRTVDWQGHLLGWGA